MGVDCGSRFVKEVEISLCLSGSLSLKTKSPCVLKSCHVVSCAVNLRKPITRICCVSAPMRSSCICSMCVKTNFLYSLALFNTYNLVDIWWWIFATEWW